MKEKIQLSYVNPALHQLRLADDFVASVSICQKEHSYNTSQKLVKVKSLLHLWETFAH